MRLGILFGRKWIATTALVLLGALVCARLGIWQLDRLRERTNANAHIALMRSLAPLTLPSSEDLSTQEYRAAQGRGTYDFDNQVAIRNQAYEGQVGYRLLTPLRLEGAHDGAPGMLSSILVDRGWIPAEGNENPQDWRKYDLASPTEVTGMLRLGQDGPSFGGVAQPPSPSGEMADFWMYIDVAQIGRQLPYAVLPVYLQADSIHSPSNFPVAQIEDLELTEGPHRGYALQWFSFAAILLIGYPFFVSRKESGRA